MKRSVWQSMLNLNVDLSKSRASAVSIMVTRKILSTRTRFGLARGAAFGTSTLLASIAGMAAMFATAAFTNRPALFLAVGWATFAVGTLTAGSMLPSPPRRRAVALTIATFTAVGAAALLMPGPRQNPTAPEGYKFVTVSTGAQLAVTKIAAPNPTKPPVIVLHGGPGIPDLEANQRVFAPLTEYGADVYLYAQLGTEASSRLSDPRGYSRERDAADLEGLRHALGLDRVVLIGHSYGAALAAQYLSERPARVAALILLSPAPLDPDDHSSDRLTIRLSASERARIYRSLALPRALTAYALLQINPRAAHAYFPDAEADFRNDIVVQGAAPALHCSGSPATEPVRGTGFYAAQYPQSSTAKEQPDIRGILTEFPTPTLILKGACDYLSWSSAVSYRKTLPNSTLLYFPGTGHNLHQDKPQTVRESIVAFLDHNPLPVPEYESTVVPPDFQGPP